MAQLLACKYFRRAYCAVLLCSVLAALSACGGSGSSGNTVSFVGVGSPPAQAEPPAAEPPTEQPTPDPSQPALPTQQTVRVQVSGLKGRGLVIQNNGADDLSIAADGTASFANKVPFGQAYQVSIKAPPELPPQTCTVAGGTGQVADSAVPLVTISCNSPPHFVFITSIFDTSVLRVDKATGALARTGFVVPYGGIKGATIAPSGRFLYLADVSAGVRAFSIDIDSGDLRELNGGSPVPTGFSEPQAMVIAPSGKYLYVANRAANRLSILAVDSSTGAPTPTSSVATGIYPVGVAITPNGRFLYVANYMTYSISAYVLDSATGGATFLTEVPVGGPSRYLTLDPTGRFLYVTGGGLNRIYAFAIDSATGNLSAIFGSPFQAGNGAHNTVVSPDAKSLYVSNETDGTLGSFSIDPATGALSLQNAPVPTRLYPEDLAIDPVNGNVYLAQLGDPSVATYARDAQTGLLSAASQTVLPVPPVGIAVLGFASPAGR